MIVATWRPGFGLFCADAQKVADEIMSIGAEVSAEQILDKARDAGTELHKCFDWDDTSAAEKYRLSQARQVVRHLVIKTGDDEREKPSVRLFHKTEHTGGYKPLTVVVREQAEYERLLERAMAELRAFKAKYHSLSELEEILALID